MLLHLVRHGIAEERDPSSPAPDADRALTMDGARKVRRHAESLLNLGVIFDEIWTSPLVRAAQTADILAETMRLGGRVRTVEHLAPGGQFDALLGMLAEKPDLESVAFVGHNPDMSMLATYLLTGMRREAVAFKKCGVACIELEDLTPPYRGELHWLLTPRHFSHMR